ncbi:MAG: aminotransferase class III-fold pyridoxal phosphate-dependent enzyme [Candidatus Micrarchaeota archaeon]|nr:aminotransferase class III-fold pyridoxal phosphate-dependent enzyme [Candidatus Micrarchaeota archaeon]
MSKKADEIIRRDHNVFLNTTMIDYNFVLGGGEGDFVYDVDGRKIIDFTSFIGVYNLGINSNVRIRNAIKKQIDVMMHGAFNEYYSELPVKFGEAFIKMFPKGFGRIFLCNSGTEAVESSVKYAKYFTKRQYTLAFYRAFHGRTMGSLGLTSSKFIQRSHFGPFTGVIHAPYVYPYRCPFKHRDGEECGEEYIDYIRENILKREAPPNEVASIIFEPVQGEGGYIVPTKSFVRGLREIADEIGAALICDEVQAGYMRTGKFLALDNFGVKADIYAMAKGLGAGMPMGAVVVKSDFGDVPEGVNANTFGGNLAAVAGAYEALKEIQRNQRKMEHDIKQKGAHIMKRLGEMKDRYGMIGDVRGLGLMIGVELVKDKDSMVPASKEREKVLKIALEKGLLLLPAGDSTIRVLPPLTISQHSIDKGLDILEESISEVSHS